MKRCMMPTVITAMAVFRLRPGLLYMQHMVYFFGKEDVLDWFHRMRRIEGKHMEARYSSCIMPLINTATLSAILHQQHKIILAALRMRFQVVKEVLHLRLRGRAVPSPVHALAQADT